MRREGRVDAAGVVGVRIGFGTAVDQGAQHLQAGLVGKMQVIDDQAA